MSDDTRPYKAGFEAMYERMHGGAAMDTLENAQKRAEYWKAEHAAANAEKEKNMTTDEIYQLLDGAANMLLGMTLDPAIPAHAKDAMKVKHQELEDALEKLYDELSA